MVVQTFALKAKTVKFKQHAGHFFTKLKMQKVIMLLFYLLDNKLNLHPKHKWPLGCCLIKRKTISKFFGVINCFLFHWPNSCHFSLVARGQTKSFQGSQMATGPHFGHPCAIVTLSEICLFQQIVYKADTFCVLHIFSKLKWNVLLIEETNHLIFSLETPLSHFGHQQSHAPFCFFFFVRQKLLLPCSRLVWLEMENFLRPIS